MYVFRRLIVSSILLFCFVDENGTPFYFISLSNVVGYRIAIWFYKCHLNSFLSFPQFGERVVKDQNVEEEKEILLFSESDADDSAEM